MKRRILSLILALVFIVALLPIGTMNTLAAPAAEQTKSSEIVAYPVTGGSILFDSQFCTVTGYKGEITAVNIPAKINGVEVAFIAPDAFNRCYSLTSVTIPDSVTTIGAYAFNECKNLTSVTIPDSVELINYCAFSDCSSLTNITIPNSVTWIGYNAFDGCSNLTSITIPDSVTEILGAAFANCSSLTSVTIPNSVTVIGSDAFANCGSLTSITIPHSVTTIGDGAFSGCSSLTGITIPDSVSMIDDWAFYGCTSLTSVTIPNSVTTIGIYAFSNCSSLTSITIPDSVTAISDWLFEGCTNLTSVTIPDSVTTIGIQAFNECESLTSVVIPDSVSVIGAYAFSRCDSLTSVVIPDSVTMIDEDAFFYSFNLSTIFYGGSQAQWEKIKKGYNDFYDAEIQYNITAYPASNGYIYFNHQTGTVIDCDIDITAANIPSSINGVKVVAIGEWAFFFCEDLISITIPNSVTTIGDSAFASCVSLTSITIPDGVTTISDATFSGCESLTRVTIPDSVTSIGDSAFALCSNLTSVAIPNSVKTIDDYAFFDCSSLTSVTIPDSVVTISDDAFYGCSSLSVICYGGSPEQWAQLDKGDNNFNDAAVHFCPSANFGDIPVYTNWAHAGIDYCVEHKLMNGISDTQFSPDGTVSRAQLVTILYRMAGSPETKFKGTFTDVAKGLWYSDAIEWAAANGVVNGIGNNKFGPDQSITREQIATILYRYSGSPAVKGNLNAFPDKGSVSDFALNGMIWATQVGLINGVSSNGITTLAPKSNATRAQIAAIIMRYRENTWET